MEKSKKITFREYFDSKNVLLSASKQAPKIMVEYIVKKYCKIPALINESADAGKLYLTLKPKTIIKIIWEHDTNQILTAKQILLDGVKYFPCWSTEKIDSWLDSTVMNKKDIKDL